MRTHPTNPWRRFVLLCCLAVWAAASATVQAQDYPNKPIRMLVGFPPGGGVDIVARLMAVEMARTLGQPITVENRAGAAGNIATDAVAKAAPDGYTVLMGNTGSLSINPSLYGKLPFNVQKDLAPVALAASSPLLVLVNPQQPAQTLQALLADAREHKGKLSYGTGGAGSISHLTFELLKLKSGADIVHVPYRGGAPAVTDLIAGQLPIVVEGVPIAAPFLKTGKLRALAITSAQRSPELPGVPTMAEAGFPDLTIAAWYGLAAPAGTPPAVVARLNAAANAALKEPAVREKLAQQGSQAEGGTPEQFAALLHKELARWAEAVKASGAKVD